MNKLMNQKKNCIINIMIARANLSLMYKAIDTQNLKMDFKKRENKNKYLKVSFILSKFKYFWLESEKRNSNEN